MLEQMLEILDAEMRDMRDDLEDDLEEDGSWAAETLEMRRDNAVVRIQNYARTRCARREVCGHGHETWNLGVG
jgi:hypothetical protein